MGGLAPLNCDHNSLQSLDNSSDVLTIRDEEENHFFLKQMKNFYGSFETVWLGIYYNIDSKRDILIKIYIEKNNIITFLRMVKSSSFLRRCYFLK